MSKEEKKHSFLEHFVEDPSAPQPVPEKKLSQANRNQAFIRYMAFLFGLAFLFVVVSMLIYQRDSRETISELNQNASSALSRVEKLQEDYRKAVEQNQELTLKLQELEDALEQEKEASGEKDAAIASLEGEKEALLQEKNKTGEQVKALGEAYELLCQAERAMAEQRYEDCKSLMDKITGSQELLGQEGKALCQRILEALKNIETN